MQGFNYEEQEIIQENKMSRPHGPGRHGIE